jgi:hypothetical protein
MARRPRSPQQKKRLSLTRDSIVGGGESPHGLRNHWGKKKRSAERARRTAERVVLVTDPDGFAPVRRRTVRKWGSQKLGDAIAGKQERRAKLQETPRKLVAARQRRKVRRGSPRKPPG